MSRYDLYTMKRQHSSGLISPYGPESLTALLQAANTMIAHQAEYEPVTVTFEKVRDPMPIPVAFQRGKEAGRRHAPSKR